MIPVAKPCVGDEEVAAVAEVIRSGWLAQGPRVAAFEASFAARVGAGHGVAVSSCTTALHLMLHALGVGPGDEVIVPSLSFIATANVVVYCGARPVFADVDLTSGNLTPTTVEAKLSSRTKAVLVVHQAGVPADVPSIAAACGDVPVLEDAACAAGSTLRGRSVGAGAIMAAWSFHPRKVLTTGEGGMITSDDDGLVGRLRRLREHGMSVSAADRHAAATPVVETYDELGFNYRMTDLQAALGVVQVDRLDAIVDRRRQLAARYHDLLGGLAVVRAIDDPPHGTTNFQSFWIELLDPSLDRGAVLGALADAGISARRGIMAAHLEPAYGGHATGSLPVTEHLTARTLILPLFHDMTEGEQALVVDVLAEATDQSSGVLARWGR